MTNREITLHRLTRFLAVPPKPPQTETTYLQFEFNKPVSMSMPDFEVWYTAFVKRRDIQNALDDIAALQRITKIEGQIPMDTPSVMSLTSYNQSAELLPTDILPGVDLPTRERYVREATEWITALLGGVNAYFHALEADVKSGDPQILRLATDVSNIMYARDTQSISGQVAAERLDLLQDGLLTAVESVYLKPISINYNPVIPVEQRLKYLQAASKWLRQIIPSRYYLNLLISPDPAMLDLLKDVSFALYLKKNNGMTIGKKKLKKLKAVVRNSLPNSTSLISHLEEEKYAERVVVDGRTVLKTTKDLRPADLNISTTGWFSVRTPVVCEAAGARYPKLRDAPPGKMNLASMKIQGIEHYFTFHPADRRLMFKRVDDQPIPDPLATAMIIAAGE